MLLFPQFLQSPTFQSNMPHQGANAGEYLQQEGLVWRSMSMLSEIQTSAPINVSAAAFFFF